MSGRVWICSTRPEPCPIAIPMIWVLRLQHLSFDMASSGSRMKKCCDCCKRYLEHLEEKKQNMTCFLRRMTGNFKHSTIVPNGFLKHFSGNLSGTIKLESPNGSIYYVEIAERYTKMVFRRGWETFINAHHIKEDDFLLFRHIENSLFEVLILDSDGCEKPFSCAGIKNIPSVREKRTDDTDISSSSEHDSKESSRRQRYARWEKGCSSHGTSSSAEDSGEDFSSENKSPESDDLQMAQGADYVLSHGNSLSEAQKERVLALIQEIKPDITVFVAIMRKSNVQLPSTHLVISKKYAFTHFPHKSMDVTLQRPGNSKKWQPRFYKRNDNRMCMLKGQWLDFVCDNHVQEGDICLFLPIKGRRKFTFMVYLLRTSASGSSRVETGFERTGPCYGRSSTKMASAVHIKEESTEGENVSMENGMHETSEEYQESDSGENASMENGMHETSEEYQERNSDSLSEPPYIVALKSCLSRSQKTIVEKRVRAIQSEFPIFVAIMTKSTIGDGDALNGRIEFGARFAASHLPDRGQTMILRCMRKIWKTKMVILPGRRRWFLRQGWPTFVWDNGLRTGDICLFELKKNERKPTMEVHIISLDMAKGAGSQMKKPCDCCKRYLNHLDEKNQNMTSFLRRMTGNFKHNTIVPNRFLKYFTEKLSGTIKLESPNGCLYDVQVMDRYDKMVLGHGWEAFVDVHHINENDSLLFRHIKECCFEVSIFDPDDCEKMFPCAGIKDTPSVQERSVDSVDVSSSSQHVTTKSSGSEKSGGSDKGRHGKTARMTAISSSSDVSGTGSSSESESFESDDLEIPKGTDYVMSSRSCLSEAQTERVIAFIHEIEPEVTVFVAILKKCHVQPPVPSLELGSRYATAVHLPSRGQTVVLKYMRKIWKAKLAVNCGGRRYLSGGWPKFVRDNGLRVGDICLLELKKNERKFTMEVHIILREQF
ncbi:hypothetical protein EJB05_05622, partial [Eragrostis curvula]